MRSPSRRGLRSLQDSRLGVIGPFTLTAHIPLLQGVKSGRMDISGLCTYEDGVVRSCKESNQLQAGAWVKRLCGPHHYTKSPGDV